MDTTTMNRNWLPLLCSLLFAAALRPPAVSAHPERVSGLVLAVLPARHAIVVRPDESGSKAVPTTLYRLSARVDIASIRIGDRIVGLVDADADPALIDELRDIPAAAPPSNVRAVVPLSVGDYMPAQTRFVDQRGRAFTFGDFHGKSVFLAFIYTRCKDQAECPLVSSHFAVLQRLLAKGPYHLVEMTLDPAFDRPAVLATYGARYGADPRRWTLATGDPDTVLDFDARFGIDPFADPRIGLIHTERAALIDPTGKITDLVEGTAWTPQDIAARLRPKDNPSGWLDLLDFYLSKATVAICGNGASGFNGLEDLAIILAILGGVGFVLQRVAHFFLVRE
jgi:protein SCO1/2